MTMQRSPGPWMLSSGDSIEDEYRIVDSDGRGVATTLARDSEAEELANAQLIAAAPELYNALLVLTDTAKSTLSSGNLDIRDAEQAIRNAKGEA